MRSSIKIAAAVAAALGAASGAAFAAAPSLAQAAAAPIKLYLAGSSAAKSPILAAIQANLCGGTSNALTLSSSGNTNFFAVSCTLATGSLSEDGTIATIYYRDEGGSVVGALPIVSGKAINQLNLADTTNIPGCTAGSIACAPIVNGTSATNGTGDTFTGAVEKKVVQLGITDLEPGVFFGDNYPTLYSPTAYGTASASQMQGLNNTAVTLFDQVFGIFVNTKSGAAASAFPASAQNTATTPGTLALPKAVITNLLQGNISNWSKAAGTNGAAVASTLAVNIVNREAGSGSRAGASIYFTGDECVKGASSIVESSVPRGSPPPTDYFSTGNVLAAANTTPGAITYASIDQFSLTSLPNLVLVSIDGVPATNLSAAQGQYDYWFEATAVTNPSVSGAPADVSSFLVTTLQSIPPDAVDVLAIPGYTASGASLPVSGTVSDKIYTNPFSRGGVSCATPASQL